MSDIEYRICWSCEKFGAVLHKIPIEKKLTIYYMECMFCESRGKQWDSADDAIYQWEMILSRLRTWVGN